MSKKLILGIMITATLFCMADDCESTGTGQKCQTAEDCTPTESCQFPVCNLKTGYCEC